MAAPLKIRYPDGVQLDDLDVGQQYQFEFRGPSPSIIGELKEIVLRRRKCPALLVLPQGGAHQVSLVIHKLAKISVAEVDLSDSKYEDESEFGGEAGV